jgi:RimJ/RimL family protein N-acetyltransferase
MALHGGTRSRAATDPFVRSNVAHWRHYQFGLYIISLLEEPDIAIGRAGIRWDRDAQPSPAVDVSVVLAQEIWGQGIASETLKALVALALDRDLAAIACSEARHAAARRVMEKVGFVYGSEFERYGRGWVRYQWPRDNKSPATVAREVAGRPT